MVVTLAIFLAALAIGVPSAQAALDPPVLGATINVRPVKGDVFVDGERLTEPRQIAVGSVVDTRDGAVRLSSARDRAGHLQSGRFSGGRFRVRQSDEPSAHGLTVLRLTGSAPAFETCSGEETVRKLGARADGRFRTRGRYSSATVRGTDWIMADRCDGTLTKVRGGKVAVRDFGLDETTVLEAGESYLAAATDTSNRSRIP